ncbi:terpene synthase family protein [Streptomyces sp. NPDC002092]
MPQNINFRFPVPCQLNSDLERARTHNLEWVRSFGLAGEEASIVRYASWDMAKLAAYMYPDASVTDLELAADLMGFWFPFDDQFEGPLGRDPVQAAEVCRDMIAIVHDPAAVSRNAPPAARAFADMWRRSLEGMSRAWQARASHNWEYYFACYPNEALARLARTVPDRTVYLHLRRGSSGGETVVDMFERLGHFEVPPHAFHSPQLRTMRRIAMDVPAFCNDVHSVEKELTRGDVDNLVLVVQSEQECSLEQAVIKVRDLINEQLDTFGRLQEEIAPLNSLLGLGSRERTAVEHYVRAMALWMPGYHQWAVETARYARQGIVPADQPGYPEDLLCRTDTR